MEAYTAFAKVYDRFMDNVPYDTWADFIHNVIERYGVSKPCRDSDDPLESERNLVLDLGCGTGILTELMYQKGYDMIGVDISEEMLEIASQRDNHENILYICQDMCELDLYSTIGTVYCSCDSINYLLENQEIEECFKGVENYLYPQGLFIFDFNTVHKYRDVIGETTIAQNEDDCSFIWDNYYDEESSINEYDLTLFIKEEDRILNGTSACGTGLGSEGEGLFVKYTETHYQRGYEISEIRDFVKGSGLKLLAMIDESEIEDKKLFDNIERVIGNSKPGDNSNTAVGNGDFYDGCNDMTERVIVIARCVDTNKQTSIFTPLY